MMLCYAMLLSYKGTALSTTVSQRKAVLGESRQKILHAFRIKAQHIMQKQKEGRNAVYINICAILDMYFKLSC